MSQIKQSFNGRPKQESSVFKKTMSPYLTESNTITTGFLRLVEKKFMNCYKSIENLENIYDYSHDK